jgi:serine/threonine protein kinase
MILLTTSAFSDLKPENLLLDSEGHIRITDFGLSKIGLWNRDDRTTTFCGTPQYVAPEVIEGKDYTKAVDWWSFGNVIYEMLVGLPPFYDQNEQKMYQLILRGRLDIPVEMNPDAADIIRKFLDRNPQTRLQDPDKIRSHPFFKGINWSDLLAKRIRPPYKPPVNSTSSVAMIDQEFLRMNISDILSSNDATGVKFDQFTYVSPNANK